MHVSSAKPHIIALCSYQQNRNNLGTSADRNRSFPAKMASLLALTRSLLMLAGMSNASPTLDVGGGRVPGFHLALQHRYSRRQQPDPHLTGVWVFTASLHCRCPQPWGHHARAYQRLADVIVAYGPWGSLGFRSRDAWRTYSLWRCRRQFRSCVKVGVAVLGSLSSISLMVSVDVEQYLKVKKSSGAV